MIKIGYNLVPSVSHLPAPALSWGQDERRLERRLEQTRYKVRISVDLDVRCLTGDL